MFYLDCGDGFTDVYMSNLIIRNVHFKNLPFVVHHLHLNKAV